VDISGFSGVKRSSANSASKEVIKRKEEGLDVVLRKQVEAKEGTNLLECVHLIHNAMPEINIEDVDLSTNFLGHKLRAPIIIDSMTGGAPMAERVNATLAKIAEEMGLGMGVGSQRAGLLSADMARTYSIARKNAPNAFLFANIGGAQLAKGLSLEDAKKLVEMISANALAIHLNPLQELVQPEGEPLFKGVLSKIELLCRNVGVPVIVKEVGAGISKEVAVKLELAGVMAVNISGSGGTSWAAVEKYRAEARDMSEKAGLGEVFWDWGIPTAASLIEVRRAVRLSLIASGGLRNGLEIAKCLSLGADACSMASPMLKNAIAGNEALQIFVKQLVTELRAAMFVTGSKDLQTLRRVRKVITPPLNYWVQA
jgi:isopentenyl-diphosphate delta-isomerase